MVWIVCCDWMGRVERGWGDVIGFEWQVVESVWVVIGWEGWMWGLGLV